MDKKKLVVIGGGAAGFFCAINAARLHPGLQVILLEKTSKLLGKVKVSGGGRCNVTHSFSPISETIKKYPRGSSFLKNAFSLFFINDTIQWFLERGVELKTEEDGRMFPVSNSSETIINCLLNEADKFHIDVRMNSAVRFLKKGKNEFEILLQYKTLNVDYVCIATGGYSKKEHFDWINNLGHTIEEPIPSLFTFNMPNNPINKLMGISVGDVSIKIAGTKLSERGPVLITHWGLSGPAVLRLSAWGARELFLRNYHFKTVLNWLPAYTEVSMKARLQQLRFQNGSQKIANKNPFGLPSRLWDYFLFSAGINEQFNWADVPSREENKLVKILCASEFEIKGKTTFKEEFVTAGGIVLNEVDPESMESKIVPGLFLAGEVLNIDGITGGYNFQSAWTTGWIAAMGIGLIKEK